VFLKSGDGGISEVWEAMSSQCKKINVLPIGGIPSCFAAKQLQFFRDFLVDFCYALNLMFSTLL
jgi:hypothetical protein